MKETDACCAIFSLENPLYLVFIRRWKTYLNYLMKHIILSGQIDKDASKFPYQSKKHCEIINFKIELSSNHLAS